MKLPHGIVKWRSMRARGIGLWFVLVLWFVLAVSLVAAGMNLVQTREDEELSFRATRADLQQVFDYQWHEDNQAPAWFISFWAWRQVAGSSEYAARLHSILYALLAAALVARLARAWFGVRAAVCALALLLVSPFFMLYALEIRMYGMVMCVTALSMWRCAVWLRSASRRSALWYGMTAALMLYTHYLLVFVIVAQLAYRWLVAPRSPRVFAQVVLAGGVCAVLWLPCAPLFIHQFNTLQRLALEAGATRGVGIHVSTEPTTWDAIVRLATTLTAGYPLIYAALFAFGIVSLRRKRARLRIYGLALLWAVGVPALFFAANLVAQVYTPRYLAFAPLGIALAAGAALARLRWAGGFALIALLIVSFLSFVDYLPQNVPPRRDLFRQVAAHWQVGDVVYWRDPDEMPSFDRWYGGYYLPVEFMANTVDSVDAAVAAPRVWFVTLDWFGTGVQDDFYAIEATHPLQQVIGDCHRRWCYLIQLLEVPLS